MQGIAKTQRFDPLKLPAYDLEKDKYGRWNANWKKAKLKISAPRYEPSNTSQHTQKGLINWIKGTVQNLLTRLGGDPLNREYSNLCLTELNKLEDKIVNQIGYLKELAKKCKVEGDKNSVINFKNLTNLADQLENKLHQLITGPEFSKQKREIQSCYLAPDEMAKVYEEIGGALTEMHDQNIIAMEEKAGIPLTNLGEERPDFLRKIVPQGKFSEDVSPGLQVNRNATVETQISKERPSIEGPFSYKPLQRSLWQRLTGRRLKQGMMYGLASGAQGTCELTYKAKPFLKTPGTPEEYTIEIGAPYAIKTGETTSNEFRILKELDHPNIIKLENKDSKKIIMKNAGVTLESAFKKTIFNFRERVAIFAQIINAIKYLHSKEVFHGDLYERNILLQTDGRISVVDFGLASFKETNEHLKSRNHQEDLELFRYYLILLVRDTEMSEFKKNEGDSKKVSDLKQKALILFDLLKYDSLPKINTLYNKKDIHGMEFELNKLLEIVRDMRTVFPDWEGLKGVF